MEQGRQSRELNGTDYQLSFFILDAGCFGRDYFAGGEMIAVIAVAAFAAGVGIGVVVGGISAVFAFKRNARNGQKN